MKSRFVFPVFLTILLNLAVCLPRIAAVGFDRTNVCAYGAIPSDGLPDTTAINNAVNAGTSIYFPPGTYIYAGAITLPPNKSYRFYGDGPGVVTILFTGPSAGINAPDMGIANLNVEGLTLMASTENCGTAINAVFSPGSVSGKFHTATIHNVQIIGTTRDGTSGGYWTNGIHLLNGTNSIIDKVHISGNKNVTQTGITLDAPANDGSTGFQLSNLEIKWCNSALLTSGHVEGIYVTGFEFTSCGWGGLPAVYLLASSGAAAHLVNGKIDSIANGLTMTNFLFGKISNVSFRHTGSEAIDGTMLALNNVTDGMITECSFYGVDLNGVANENGIFLTDSHSVRIAGNNFNNMRPVNGSCIVVFPASTVVRITDNLFSTVRQQYLIHPSVPSSEIYYAGNNP